MKLSVAVLAIAGLLVAGTAAMAQLPALDEQQVPPANQETGVLEWVAAGWVPVTDHRCEAFHIGSSAGYWCNGQYVNEATGEVEVFLGKFYVGASVAQYIEATLSNNALAWYIGKPYLLDPITREELDRDWAADSITLQVKSNGDIRLDFDSFDPLLGTGGGTIPSYWTIVQNVVLPPPVGDPAWQTGSFGIGIPEAPDHPLLTYKLWNRLHTGKCTSACLYEDEGAIFIVLEDQKDWIIDKLPIPVEPRPDP